MANIESRLTHLSGIPLGGLGTGSVEIRPDGYFHEWQIFNLGQWAPNQPEVCQCKAPAVGPDGLSFFVRVKQGRRNPVMRRLGVRADQENPLYFAWLKGVQSITFNGRFPVAQLSYNDEALPVAIQSTIFSPFIPHDARASGTPGFYVDFKLKNRSRETCSVSLVGALKNFIATGLPDRKLVNSIASERGTTFLTMRTEADASSGCAPTIGSMCLSVRGGSASWIKGEYGEFTTGYFIGPWVVPNASYSVPHETWFYDLLDDGQLPSLAGDRVPTALLPETEKEIDALSDKTVHGMVTQLLQHPFVASLWRRLEVCHQRPGSPAEFKAFLKDVSYRMYRKKICGLTQEWGDGALCSAVTLKPGEEKEVGFAVSWHFPVHYSRKGTVLGHAYENWFRDAGDVGRFLAKNRGQLSLQTQSFARALYDTTLDPVLADAWSSQLSTLVKCTWWTRAGDFGVWEGLGCCGFHTTDITYEGSFNILALFPELQKRQMEMGARFQREDGRVHHFFTPDFSEVDTGFDRVDMNQQFVLLACRDYLWTGDREYLNRMWPHIVRAMESTAALDMNGDGLPDHDTRRNTYDAWDFRGTPAYIASLWLGALRAAIRLAEDLGEVATAARWKAILGLGAASFDAKLWNGKYYRLWVDGKDHDDCCMSDQLGGEWFAHIIGLGSSLPDDKILAALQSIYRYNFRPGEGLINASYPPGVVPRIFTWRNLQAVACWTGIEYPVAAMMMECGLAREGLAIVREIDSRHVRVGRIWNHQECGEHYYRAMSSWAVLLAATGFKVDVPNKTVTIAPAFRGARVRAPWVSSSGWGTFEQTGKRFELTCAAGELVLSKLSLRLPGKRFSVTVGKTRFTPDVSRTDGLTTLDFGKAVSIRAGTGIAIKG